MEEKRENARLEKKALITRKLVREPCDGRPSRTVRRAL